MRRQLLQQLRGQFLRRQRQRDRRTRRPAGVRPRAAWAARAERRRRFALGSCSLLLLALTLILAACGTTAGRDSGPGAQATATAAALSRLSLYVSTGASCPDCLGYPGAHRIVALDAASGAIRQEYGNDTDLAISSAPLVQDGVIYAATLQPATLHHELVAITTKDGAVLWRRPLSFNVFEAPVLADGVLLVVEEELSDRQAILSTHLDAFDAATGTLRWTRAGDSLVGIPAPQVRDGVVFIPLDGALSALRLRDGTTLWRTALPQGTNGRPAVDDKGLVYEMWQNAPTQDPSSALPAGYVPTGYVAALRAADGTVVWRSETIGGVTPGFDETPFVAEGLVYEVSSGRVFVLDAATGRALWHYPEQPSVVPPVGVRGAVLAGGTVYLSLLEGTYLALDAHTGAVRWQTPSLFDVDLGTPVSKLLALFDLPLVAGDLLFSEFVGDYRLGKMVALDTRTGALRWHTPLTGALYPAFCLAP